MLAAAGRRAADGSGAGGLLLTGEPGAGKTALSDTALASWRNAGAVVLTGSCQPYAGEDLAYTPFVAALSRAEGAGQRRFGSLLAELAQLGALPAAVARGWLFDRVLAELDRRADGRLLVLRLEDLHWADRYTLDLTRFLAAAAAERRLLLICTARSDGVGGLAAAQELASVGLVRLALRPLSDHAAGALVRAVLRCDTPGCDTPGCDSPTGEPTGRGTQLVDDLVARSGGNPYLARELATAARDGGPGLPTSLRRALLQRISDAGPAGGTVLAAVAAAAPGPRAVLDGALVALLGRRGPELAVELTRSGLLVPDDDGLDVGPGGGAGGGAGGLRPRHALLAEVAADDLPVAGLRAVHAALATAWGQDPAAARHWEAAGEPARALAAWRTAGRFATAAGDYAAAAHAYTRAVALGGSGAGGDRLAVEAAEALHRAGEDDRAVAVLRAVLAGAAVPEPAVRLALLDRLQDCLFAAGDAPAAFAVLEEAVALADRLPPSRESARIVAVDGSHRMIRSRFAEGASRSATAAALAADLGADDTLAYAWTTRGVCMAATGDVAGGLALLSDAGRLAGACGSISVAARTDVNLCYVLANVGRYEACAAAGREALARLSTRSLAHTIGAPIYYNTVVALVALGQWDEALAVCAAAEAAPVSATTVRFLALARARVAALRGQPEVAHEALRVARGDRPPGEPAFDLEHALAGVLTLRVHRRPWEALDMALAALRGSPGGLDALRLCAEALRTVADLTAAGGRVRRFDDRAAIVAELRQAAAAEDDTWGTRSPEAAALRRLCTAELGRLAGPAAGPWQAVAAGWEELGLRPDAAYAQVRLATALVATRRAADAGPPLHAAYRTATELQAQPLLAEIGAVARRGRLPLPLPGPLSRGGDPTAPGSSLAEPASGASASGAPAPTSPDAGHRTATLTHREREVLDLLCLGRTNRQIARQLVISEKTAGVHVSHVLAKLGAGNRVEAVRLSRPGPVPT